MKDKVHKAKFNKDKEYTEATKLFNIIPTYILQIIVHILPYCAACIGFEFPFSGVKPDRFGHVIISNVGVLDFDQCFAPLCSPMFCQCLAATGKIKKEPMVDEKTGEIVVKEICKCSFALDHRYSDAGNVVSFFKVAKTFIEDPNNFDPSEFKDLVCRTEFLE